MRFFKRLNGESEFEGASDKYSQSDSQKCEAIKADGSAHSVNQLSRLVSDGNGGGNYAITFDPRRERQLARRSHRLQLELHRGPPQAREPLPARPVLWRCALGDGNPLSAIALS
jgi:hypothetical protein